MPLVPSTASLPSSMSTFAYLREQKILNIIYIGLLVIEALMVLGVALVAVVKRVKLHRRLKTLKSRRPTTPTTYYPPYEFISPDTKKPLS
ncbi:hypothetical protein FALBO_15579 [Fusarium albosuccineum]|uniref:Uncharacterized protein n=1 Tax=Fusarium albosuccineum TaxID=1237068 RepID=A0A8H4KUR7_9HYPO|nr:hypothetical protein FALBO_15579 [Fusarium albosuccineum]